MLVNTGRKEKKQIDSNPNSLTFGQFRWVDAGEDLVLCPLPAVPVYASLEISQMIFRNNCAAGYFGSGVMFTVPAGQFTSLVDQATANALAQAYFDANAQNYANSQGACYSNQND